MPTSTPEVAGTLRHRVSIAAFDGTVLETVWARVEPLPGAREYETPAPPSHQVTLRYPGFRVTDAMHLIFGDRVLDILSVVDVDEIHDRVHLLAAQRVDATGRVAVAFTRHTQTYDEATARTTETVTTIAGTAVQVAGQPERYEALGLILGTMPTLLFRPTADGLHANTADFVQPGDRVTWAGRTYAVKDVDATAPNGIVTSARIVIAT